uniref:DUF4781 domain-containing protein n=1 Tax=Stomoxys calcitrans TaxID=35570 RepID=A0A1I8Q4C6_STOCA
MEGKMGEMRQELLEEFGSEEYPYVKTVKISSLTTEKLTKMLKEKDIPFEDSMEREQLEELLKFAMGGGDEIVEIEVVKIDRMSYDQLKEALAKVTKPKKSIREIQQELAENCGFGEAIIWDQLDKSDGKVMKKKIKQLIPDQEKGQKSIEKMRETLFNSVWAQRKYTNGSSVTSIFYVMVTNEEDFNIAPESTKFSCHPIFRCRKCNANYDSSKCCMVYVDEVGRVYQNWKSFVDSNVLPAGTMVSPRRGVYNFDQSNKVILDVYATPNGMTSKKVLNVAQTGSAVLGVGAACVPLAALALPVAAPVMAGAAIIGLGVGAFSSITSALNLRDRAVHEQSLSVTDSQARSSYFGLAGGFLGMASVGATRFMTSMAATGKATAGIEVFVNSLNISSIVLSGSGVANGVLDLIFKYQDDDEISALDVLQLSASLVLFTHSLYNFQLASRIANEARTNSIKSYRETLSNRQRRMFDKMSKETIRIRGDKQGKIDIVRNINKIPDRQYLNDLFKVNKNLNEAKVRPSFGGDGIVLNNEMPIDAGVLRQNVNLLDQVASPIPQTHSSGESAVHSARMLFVTNGVGTRMHESVHLQDTLNDYSFSGRLREKFEGLVIVLANGALMYLSQCEESFLQNIVDGESFEAVILSMAQHLSEQTFKFLLDLAQLFINDMLDDIVRVLGFIIPTESVLYRILEFVSSNYKDFSYNFIVEKGDEILVHIKNYFSSLNANCTNKNKLVQCTECEGHYFVCAL